MVQVLSTLKGEYSNTDDFPSMIEASIQMEEEKNSGQADGWNVREFENQFDCVVNDNTIDMYLVDLYRVQ